MAINSQNDNYTGNTLAIEKRLLISLWIIESFDIRPRCFSGGTENGSFNTIPSLDDDCDAVVVPSQLPPL